MTQDKHTLTYQPGDQMVPIPAAEHSLQTVTATPWFQVSEEALQLEGLQFDRFGNLYFVEVFGGQIFQFNPTTKELKVVVKTNDDHPAALKIHKDGRLFVACLGNFKNSGGVYAMTPDGLNKAWIVPQSAGYVIDDLVFDDAGGFYFTDFKGSAANPIGGVYYVSPDYQHISPIVNYLAIANGVALSTDERKLWITEMANNRLHCIELNEDRVSIPDYGTSVPYHFIGAQGPDSCCIDADDNLYVAMYQQGRVLVFNRNGFPLGQVLLPGRANGHMLRSTHPALRPTSNELIICANDWTGGQGSWLFKAGAFGQAHNSFQFR